MMFDIETLNKRRWFGLKGIEVNLLVEDEIDIGAGGFIIFSAMGEGMHERYAVPVRDGREADLDTEFVSSVIEHMNRRSVIKGKFPLEFIGESGLDTPENLKYLDISSSNVLVSSGGYLLKSYRHMRRHNREPDILFHLRRAGFDRAPASLGTVKYDGMNIYGIQEIVPGTDAGRIYSENMAAYANGTADIVDAAMLGRTIKDMHNAMEKIATSVIGDFPELHDVKTAIKERIKRRLYFLSHRLSGEKMTLVRDAAECLYGVIDGLDTVALTHGDLHLGQTMYDKGGYYIIDFEGEPDYDALPLYPYVRDIATVIRSLDYMAVSSDLPTGEASEWRDAVIEALNAGYGTDMELTIPWQIEKAIYEVQYELKNRPDMVWVPLQGLENIRRTMDETGYLHKC